MWRFCLIVIFSAMTLHGVSAQAVWIAYYFGIDQTSTGNLATASGYYVSPGSGQVAWSHVGRNQLDFPKTGDGLYSVFFEPEGFSSNVNGIVYANKSFQVVNGVATEVEFVGWENHPDNPEAALDEYGFEFFFGPEFGGSEVKIISATGEILASYVIPEGGTVLGGTVTAPSLEGAYWEVDGVFAGSIDDPASAPNVLAVRPTYGFTFDESYTGHDWEIRRADGSIAASGSASSFQTMLDGRFTIAGEGTAEVWVRAPAGDGMTSEFIPTGVTFGPPAQGSESTFNYSFTNNPNSSTEPPSFEYPATTEPLPRPTEPAFSGTTGGTTTIDPDDIVQVDVGTATLPDIDDGEEAILQKITTMQQTLVGIFADLDQTQANLATAATSLNSLRLSGVGSNCSFAFGPYATINLQTSGPVRAGLTLLIIGVGGFAAASMLRSAVQ